MTRRTVATVERRTACRIDWRTVAANRKRDAAHGRHGLPESGAACRWWRTACPLTGGARSNGRTADRPDASGAVDGGGVRFRRDGLPADRRGRFRPTVATACPRDIPESIPRTVAANPARRVRCSPDRLTGRTLPAARSMVAAHGRTADGLQGRISGAVDFCGGRLARSGGVCYTLCRCPFKWKLEARTATRHTREN